MQIIRVEDDVKKSQIDGIEVARLPKGLRTKMLRLLKKLTGVKIISLGRITTTTNFEFAERNVPLAFFDRKIRKEFQETINLLKWWLTPHWLSMSSSDAIGGEVYCMDCNHMMIAGSGGEYCPNPSCPSHKKWRMVIGPSYEPPTESFPFERGLTISRQLRLRSE